MVAQVLLLIFLAPEQLTLVAEVVVGTIPAVALV
jgi:hypothetical protein